MRRLYPYFTTVSTTVSTKRSRTTRGIELLRAAKNPVIHVLSPFMFCPNLCFVTVCALLQIVFCAVSLFVFCHKFCFSTIYVSSQFVFHHSLCFITVCVSSQFVFHNILWVDRGNFFNKVLQRTDQPSDRPTDQQLDF